MATLAADPDVAGISPFVLSLRQALQDGATKTLARFALGELEVELATSGRFTLGADPASRQGRARLARRICARPVSMQKA